MWLNLLRQVLDTRYFEDTFIIIKFIEEGKNFMIYVGERIDNKEKVLEKKYRKLNINQNDIINIKIVIEYNKLCNFTHIVQFIDIFEDLDSIYIIKEYMNYESLPYFIEHFDKN